MKSLFLFTTLIAVSADTALGVRPYRSKEDWQQVVPKRYGVNATVYTGWARM